MTERRVDAKSKKARRNLVRERRKNPATKERDEAWLERIAEVKRAEPMIEEAGFNTAAHYWPGGVPSYCMCGTVQDHNAKFDRLVEAANIG